MTESLTETLTEAAQAAVRADHLERDREAWNLPRASTEAVPQEPDRDRLDWDGFRDLYYPDSRRHNLKAIVAYGEYRRPPLAGRRPAGEAGRAKGDAISTEALSLEGWEDEGGTSD
jgi:hypothetical protein